MYSNRDIINTYCSRQVKFDLQIGRKHEYAMIRYKKIEEVFRMVK
jgi:hypothetical protein